MTEPILKQESFLKVDETILCLFPSLDFNRVNVHANSKKKMNTMLKILDCVAKCGVITHYDLTKNIKDKDTKTVFPRMGGQTSQKALQELREIDLLETQETTSSKKSRKIPHFLTAKGVLVCLSIPEFQKTEKLDKILQSPTLKESKLATLLKIYNQGYIRKNLFKDAGKKEHSDLVALLREFGERGFNLELKNQEVILNDLRENEYKMFDDMLKFRLSDGIGFFVDFFTEFIKGFISPPNEETKRLKEQLITLYHAMANDKNPSTDLPENVTLAIATLKEPSNDKTLSEKTNKIETAQLIQYAINLITDPECLAFRKQCVLSDADYVCV